MYTLSKKDDCSPVPFPTMIDTWPLYKILTIQLQPPRDTKGSWERHVNIIISRLQCLRLTTAHQGPLLSSFLKSKPVAIVMRIVYCCLFEIFSGREQIWPKDHMLIFFVQNLPSVAQSGLATLSEWHNGADTALPQDGQFHKTPEFFCSELKYVLTHQFLWKREQQS